MIFRKHRALHRPCDAPRTGRLQRPLL